MNHLYYPSNIDSYKSLNNYQDRKEEHKFMNEIAVDYQYIHCIAKHSNIYTDQYSFNEVIVKVN